MTVADGSPTPATIVAWDLGTCDGKPAYLAADWYFPDRGETFDPSASHYNICTGDIVG